jgi:hypothetical protein
MTSPTSVRESLPTTSSRERPQSPLEREYHPLAAFLSYLIPGLGQIAQGRIGKGILFFVCVLTLFYYGMLLGSWRNVYLPRAEDNPFPEERRILWDLWNRPQFVAQFWIGMAAWPAVSQYISYQPDAEAGPVFGSYQRAPAEKTLNELQTRGDKTWDLGWVFTVIAGALNVMVIYDALAGPAFVFVGKEESEG